MLLPGQTAGSAGKAEPHADHQKPKPSPTRLYRNTKALCKLPSIVWIVGPYSEVLHRDYIMGSKIGSMFLGFSRVLTVAHVRPTEFFCQLST